MSTIKYILFDAANTLIHKPDLWDRYLVVLKAHGYSVSETDLKYCHKIISETIKFPDVTSQEFYNYFNKELLNAFGIIETTVLLDDIFNTCKNLPWQPFLDTISLHDITLPLGVLSNFSALLTGILKENLPSINFSHIFVSEVETIAKPNADFFLKAVKSIGLPPEQILYVGDSLKLDIIPALSIGMNAKLIDRQKQYIPSPYRIESLADLVHL